MEYPSELRGGALEEDEEEEGGGLEVAQFGRSGLGSPSSRGTRRMNT